MNSPRIDLINMAGRKIDPASIEQALEAVEGVEFAIAFGSATPGRPEMGEQIHACLELSEGTNLTQVQASIRAGIHGRESPRSVHAFEDVAEEHPSSRSREAWRGWFRANPPSRRRTSLPVMP